MINLKMLMSAAVTTAMVVGCAADKSKKCCDSKEKCATEMKMTAEPKVSKTTARQTAQAKYPACTVNEGKMESWKGKPYWMFDIATAGTPNITEVAVDQDSGKIVWTNVQTPEERAKEEAEEKGEK